MKCLPHKSIQSAAGSVIHDSHAEVLAIRAFNRWLVDECAHLARKDPSSSSIWVRWRRTETTSPHRHECPEGAAAQPFQLMDDVSIHMFCSEAPCGDASMELVMAAQADASPWTALPRDGGMLGRGHFDRLGVVRRKPSRSDAPATYSKSCSDKLALKQCTGLLSGLTTRLVRHQNVYLRSLVLPATQYVPGACARCFGPKGRLSAINTVEVQREWASHGYAYRPFDVETTTREFEYSRRSSRGAEAVASNICAVITPIRHEVLINGVLQGRKLGDKEGASCISRRRMWESIEELAEALQSRGEPTSTESWPTYAQIKTHRRLDGRAQVKRCVGELALQGWSSNTVDDHWTLEEASCRAHPRNV